jgi:hypothetical protein
LCVCVFVCLCVCVLVCMHVYVCVSLSRIRVRGCLITCFHVALRPTLIVAEEEVRIKDRSVVSRETSELRAISISKFSDMMLGENGLIPAGERASTCVSPSSAGVTEARHEIGEHFALPCFVRSDASPDGPAGGLRSTRIAYSPLRSVRS